MKNPYANMRADILQDPTAWAEPETMPEADAPTSPQTAEAGAEHSCPACPSRAEMDDLRLRTMAEMENFKRRLQREQDEKSKYAVESVLADLLPALDSLDLAICYAKPDKDASLLQGITMTRKLLLDALKPHGLVPVGEPGEAFDHELHEAIGEEERADLPAAHVAALLQRGYKLKDRLLRPAKVMVSREPT